MSRCVASPPSSSRSASPSYSFAFDAPKPSEAFVARARGDLDGDGLLSTFEIRGGIAPADKPKLVPGMYVEAELE